MTKILFSNAVTVPGYDVEIFWEKYWERGLVKPLWRCGETWKTLDGRTISRVQSSHLFRRPNIKRLIKKYYPFAELYSDENNG